MNGLWSEIRLILLHICMVLYDKGKITRREARGFGLNNTITKSIQSHCEKRYNATVYQTSDIQSGDYFFLCSDGVLEYVTNARLQHILCSDASDVDKMVQIEAICRDKSTDFIGTNS